MPSRRFSIGSIELGAALASNVSMLAVATLRVLFGFLVANLNVLFCFWHFLNFLFVVFYFLSADQIFNFSVH